MRKTKAIIDLNALRHNAALAKKTAPDSVLIGVIKANAYGHGAVAAAQALDGLCGAFAVAYIDEAVELQDSGIKKDILLLEGFTDADELKTVADRQFWTVVHHQHQLDFLDHYTGPPLKHITLKVDTGMHRLGLTPEETRSAAKKMKENGNAQTLSLTTHFSISDLLDDNYTRQQIDIIQTLAAELDLPIAMANSGGILGWDDSHSHWNRAGIMLYGVTPFDHAHPAADQLQAVMTLQAPVIALRSIDAGECVGYGRNWCAKRKSTIATLAIGYADGYPRVVKAGTDCYIHGQRAKLVGNISMDMITIDVTDIPEVTIGDMVELWGKNIPVNEVAMAAGTIGYELVARVAPRVPRIYEGTVLKDAHR